MYEGKYRSSGSHKRSKKKPAILIVALVLLLVVMVGGTVAFLRAASDQVTNVFTPGEVKVNINEKTTSTTKSDISFTNPDKDENGNPIDTVPVYIRATLAIYWTDAFDLTDDGVNNPTQEIIQKPAGDQYKVTVGSVLEENGWFEVDGVYYYALPVEPGSSTLVMLDTIYVTLPENSTVQCHIDVHAEAIQAEPESVVEAAWQDVEVYTDENGNKLLRAK